MKIDVLSLFPSMFDGVFGESILKKAQEKNAVELNVVNFREYSTNKHQNVDDYPYGGGAGMVLTPQPIFDAVEKLTRTAEKPRVVLLCPQGERYTQAKAEELAAEEHLIFICGHYEGYDERIREQLVTDEISIGDYVLTGGELGAMVVIDSVVRLLPDVLGNNHSAVQDSHSTGLLEHPHYTRPADFRGLTVPEVLMSGNHKKIEQWRQKESLKRTLLRRPDMLEKMELTEEQKKLVAQLKEENQLS
ncbi:tRNA (guanosine(37)-N1)-methyltransferase TrmD [Priestia megaterium]|jgi:tRNA (guanine37-N1)-methyltransferase|uniref:tRNA (guanine-N(1)-)-methyltransferase n=1 Tax=Priestia megaterium (strain ATCC 14581 / DSM 32 / CCUG 1817 / JCM 2506 / NBRC 15308 / NCIMB 9376 / NCTC 10342 / NRRL B-14308 / VKM B-512 / Ford 19) TaxID=1348623 RepID=A0A0B6A5H8_PRIM2|nr:MULTISPECIES: tRNA (guanosine(37)-N1)-methyltransferase TrmD [Priestia]AJI20205.1 tRNA (guanine(37)-N(1))-methyltransferase [Priestia megaterium NBRC 15308 = ATCC 14581]KFN00700.1 tRNA (guanine(37)-N(1))-methyltransferase [Priestia megaterium]KGJ73134.1 tRNA (guanine-N1)-methyltransferase [Priestia megaterium NBRC 15308 = ATCC 14581]MBU8753033.1 tRNA (guanosine(37)-N1)-methyltransferase TrmD [Priestia megaterium]MCU7708092.1 tRNA (guanosine(37)-N1)-methyltransferase TrmD [Priestia megateriu